MRINGVPAGNHKKLEPEADAETFSHQVCNATPVWSIRIDTAYSDHQRGSRPEVRSVIQRRPLSVKQLKNCICQTHQYAGGKNIRRECGRPTPVLSGTCQNELWYFMNDNTFTVVKFPAPNYKRVKEPFPL